MWLIKDGRHVDIGGDFDLFNNKTATFNPHISDEKLIEIKEQLVSGLQELNIEVERIKMEIGEKSLTCQLRYDTIPPAISASGFPCNINIFYRLLSIDRDEKIMTIDIPYKKHALLC